MRITMLLLTAVLLFAGCASPDNHTINGSVQELGPKDSMPQAISMPKPEYPDQLVRAGVKGTVLVEFSVAKDGSVTWAKAIESPDQRLSALAEAAVKKCRYTPGTHNGAPAACRMRLPVNFGI